MVPPQSQLRPSVFGRPARSLLLAVLAGIGMAAAPPDARLTLVERAVIQDQGSWRVDYRLRYDGASGLIVNPEEIQARIEGWVSNSRVASHALPRHSTLVIAGQDGLAATTEVIASAEESQRCRERALLQIWTGDADPPPAPVPARTGARASATAAAVAPPAILSLAPGATVRVRLRLEHQHFLYGDYDPLLGLRAVELRLGKATLNDPIVPLDREQYLAQPTISWPAPPEDRRDTRHYISAPDSLHLEAHIPGNQYYRFPERPVRYGTRMRLRYWYLIATGTEGHCRARIAQYKDTPTAWKVLSDGAREEVLTTVGRWVHVERTFRTAPEATTLALEFRLDGSAEVGEMWIDDVRLEPVAAAPCLP